MANGNPVQTENALTLIVEFDQTAAVSKEDDLRAALAVNEARDHTREALVQASEAQSTFEGLEEFVSGQGWIQLAKVFRPDQLLRASVYIHGTALSPFQAAHRDIFSKTQTSSNLEMAHQVLGARNWLKAAVVRKLQLSGKISPNDRVAFSA